MLAIIDYGVGNLFSLMSSIKALGFEAKLVKTPQELKNADKIILPGVGAYEDASKKLKKAGLDKALIHKADEGAKILGICLGMQLLFDESEEFGRHVGLGLIPGKIISIKQELQKKSLIGYKTPHMGWNMLENIDPACPLTKNSGNDYVYFVHSFYAQIKQEYIMAESKYGIEITALVQNKNIFGTQFHPEKSGSAGLKILNSFLQM